MDNPLRILHLTTSFPSNTDDATGPFVLRLLEALEKTGTECRVLTPASTGPSEWPDDKKKVIRFRYAPWSWQCLAQQPGGIPVALSKKTLLYAVVPFFIAKMGLDLVREACNHDLIHAHWSICGAIAVITQRFHQRPVITTLHGSDHHRAQGSGIYAWFHKKAVGGSVYTVGVSETIVDQLRSQDSSYAERLRFIPNGVDDAFYAINRNPSLLIPTLNFLYIGSLIPRKGVEVLLKGMLKLQRDLPWHLTIVGEGPEHNKLSALVENTKITSQISFLGPLSPSQIPEIMKKHHVLILSSYKEGRPSVVLEAMAAGMPVVATDIDGTRELVQDNRTGWLFPPGDADRLAAILSSMFRGEKDLSSAGLAGRQWMQEQGLTWSETARNYRNLYAEAIRDWGGVV